MLRAVVPPFPKEVLLLPENRHVRFLLGLLYAALALLGLWLALHFLLPWLAPFLVALLLAHLLEKPVSALSERLKLPRWTAAMLCTVALYLLLGALVGLLLWRAGYELALLLGRLPSLLAGLPSLGKALENWGYRLIIAAPVGLQESLRSALEALIQRSIALPNRLYDLLAGFVGGAVSALPDGALFLFTTALATYFSSAGRPQLLALFRRLLPPAWQPRLEAVKNCLRGALGQWLRAQGLLMLITFAELTVGLFLLRVDLALLLAALIALVDALPVFGTGTVLLPWAVLALLAGNWQQALGLVILYGVITTVRSLVEPQLVGKRLGLHPLAALCSMYVGFRALGIAGMILAPLGAMLVKQLFDAGVISLNQR